MATPVRAWRLLDGRNHKNQHRNELGFDTFSAARNPQSRNRQSTAHSPQPTVRNPQSAIRNPQSAIRNPQSAISDFQILAVNASQAAPSPE
jgi:hypothetical protein